MKVMANKKSPKKTEKSASVEATESTPVVKGVKAVDEFEKIRNRTDDTKLKTKADDIHEVMMGVRPGPITVKPSGGWLSYLSGKIRFGALEVRKEQIKVHSLALKDKKIDVEIIKITADDKVPIEKIRSRAEDFIAAKLAKAKDQ